MLRPRSDGLPHLSRFHPPQKDRPLLCWADAVSRVGWEGAAERPRYSQRPTVAWVVGSAEVGLGQRSHRGSDSLQRGRWKETLNSYCKRYLYGIFTYYAYLPLSLSLKFFFFLHKRYYCTKISHPLLFCPPSFPALAPPVADPPPACGWAPACLCWPRPVWSPLALPPTASIFSLPPPCVCSALLTSANRPESLALAPEDTRVLCLPASAQDRGRGRGFPQVPVQWRSGWSVTGEGRTLSGPRGVRTPASPLTSGRP